MADPNVPAPDLADLTFRFYDPRVKKYSERIPESRWEEHRPLLTYFHNEHLARSDMLRILRDEHNFQPSVSQLNTKMAQWHLPVYARRERHDPEEVHAQTTASNVEDPDLIPHEAVALDDLNEDLGGEVFSSAARSPNGSSIESTERGTHPDLSRFPQGSTVFPSTAGRGVSQFLDIMEHVTQSSCPNHARTDPDMMEAGRESLTAAKETTTMLNDYMDVDAEDVSSADTAITRFGSIIGDSSTLIGSLDGALISRPAFRRRNPLPINPGATLLLLLSSITDLTARNQSLYDAVLDDIASITFPSRLFSATFSIIHPRSKYLQPATGDLFLTFYDGVLAKLICIGSATTKMQVLLAEAMIRLLVTDPSLLHGFFQCDEANQALLVVLRESLNGNHLIEQLAKALRKSEDLEHSHIPKSFMRQYFIREIWCPGNTPDACDCTNPMNTHSNLITDFARDWGVPLTDETSAVWSVLRESPKLIQGLDSAVLPFGGKGSDTYRDDHLPTFSSTLGCYMIRKYVSQICDDTIFDVRSLSEDDRAFKLAEFRCKIKVIMVLAALAVRRCQISGFDPVMGKFTVPQLTQSFQDILNLPSNTRAAGFNEVYEELYIVDLVTRQAEDERLHNIPYVMETASLLAQASVKLRSQSIGKDMPQCARQIPQQAGTNFGRRTVQVQYTQADPIIGNRMSVDAQSIVSHTSSGKSFRVYAQQLMAKRGSKASLQTMSSGWKSVFSHRSWDLNTAAGYPASLSSDRASIVESMEVGS